MNQFSSQAQVHYRMQEESEIPSPSISPEKEVRFLEFRDFIARRDEVGTQQHLIVYFEGKIANNNSYEINRKIHQLFSGVSKDIILDLSRLEYMNSTGVAILFSLFFRIKDSGHRFVIGSLHPFLKRIFSLMDMPDGLDIFEDSKRAIEEFDSSS